MDKQEALTYAAIIGGIAALFQILEYVFTKNVPWLFRLVRRGFRRLKRKLLLGAVPLEQRFIVLNFSHHPVLPGQRRDIQKILQWPSLEVLDAHVENAPENRNFRRYLARHVEEIDLLPEEWQTARIVVIPAGYTPAWSVILAELHGRWVISQMSLDYAQLQHLPTRNMR